jgi:hypothetical protein
MRFPMLPILIVLAAPTLGAQRLRPSLPQLQLRFTAEAPPLVAAQDHAWEGAKIGGLVFGLGTIGLAYSWCDQGDDGHATTFGYCAPRALLGGLAGATIGAIIGGFIGSAFPRTPADSIPQP